MLLTVYSAIAQNPFIRHFTTQDGLPTNTLYQMIQDKDKFIWIGSDAGVIKYDGSVFTNYRKKDGLSSNDIVRVKEDFQGRIWLSNYNSSVDYIQNNVIHNSSNTPFLNNLSGRSFFLNFFVDKDSALCFYNYNDQVFRLDRNNKVKMFRIFNKDIKDPQKEEYFKILGIVPVNDREVQVFTHLNTYIVNIYGDFKCTEIDTLSTIGVYSINDGSFYFTTTHGIYKKTNNKIELVPFDHDSRNIFDIKQDSKGNLWVDVLNEGIYCFKEDKQIALIKIKDAHGLLLDDEDNLWISTRKSGLYFLHHDILNSDFIENEKFKGKEIQLMISDSTYGIWLVTEAGVLLKHKNLLYSLQLPNPNYHIVSFQRWGNSIYCDVKPQGLLYSFNDISLDNTSKLVRFNSFKWYHFFARNFLPQINRTQIWTYDQNYISRTSASDPFESFDRFKIDEKINLAYFNSENELVINARKNYLFKDSVIQPYRLLSVFDGTVFYNQVKLNSSSYLLNTNNDSLYIINKDRIVNLSAALSIPALSQIKKIKYINNDLYLASYKEVYICHNPLRLLDNPNETINIDALPISFNNINDLIVSNDSLYVATSDGLLVLSIKSLFETPLKPPIPYVVSLALNDSVHAIRGSCLEFSGESKIEILIGAIDFYDGTLIYSYQLEGADDKWNSYIGDRLSLVYQNLPPGTYHFKVRVTKTNSDWSEPLILTVKIKPTLFQNWFFRSFIILLLIGAVTLFFFLRRTRKMKKIQDEMQLLMMEQKALQAMMNPHFIFNSLGSIQNYLLQNKNSDAVIYLSDLAKHIRHNLDSIKTSFVLLDDEVDRLVNYLNLEKTRLDGRFEFDIQIDEGLDEDTVYIPGMMVQPFVENAIWHGIATLPGGGKIQIRFDRVNSRSLVIIIQDNGIGLKEGLINTEKSSHKSGLGISITRKRLQLLGKKFGVETGLIISDADPEASNPGTRVELKVPFTDTFTD